MLGASHRCLGFAGIHDNDFRPMFVPHDPLPHDGVGYAEIGPDEHDDIRLLEICVSIWRRVKAEGLFVSGNRGSHALTGVAVAMDHTHPEFRERTEEGQFFINDLASAKPGDGFRAEPALQVFETLAKNNHGALPIARQEIGARFISKEWSGCAIRRPEWGERFPTFGTGHSEVNWIISGRRQVNGFAITQMGIESATRRAKATDQSCGVVGLEASRHLTQTEFSWVQHEILCKRAGPLPERRESLTPRFRRDGDCGSLHWMTPPGMRGAAAVTKKQYRSITWELNVGTKAVVAKQSAERPDVAMPSRPKKVEMTKKATRAAMTGLRNRRASNGAGLPGF